jgi:hypothetical protein
MAIMNIFKYLEEEEDITESKLAELVKNFTQETREEIFDGVKLICDLLRGHGEKQTSLLLAKIPKQDAKNGCQALIEETVKARDLVTSEIGNLVMVHVDEPGYKEYLANLLRCAQNYFKKSKSLYARLPTILSPELIKSIDEDLTMTIHSDVGFNTLQEKS